MCIMFGIEILLIIYFHSRDAELNGYGNLREVVNWIVNIRESIVKIRAVSVWGSETGSIVPLTKTMAQVLTTWLRSEEQDIDKQTRACSYRRFADQASDARNANR